MATGYIFFDADLRDRFMADLAARAIACTTREDTMEGFVVELATEPDEDTLDAIEDAYDALAQEQMLRAEERPEWGSHQVASLRVTLPDGSDAQVRLPPEVARPLLERYTVEEAHALVSAIARSLADPQDGPLCRKDLLKPRA